MSDELWESWGRAADAEGVSISEWLRMAADVRLADLVLPVTVAGEKVLEIVRTETVPDDSAGQVDVHTTASQCLHPRRFREVKGPLVRCSPELGGCGAKL